MFHSRPLRQGEFIALQAFLTATVALSIDAMLPALPQIGAALSPENLNRAPLVLTTFVFGMGIGTLFTGPLSDSLGRRTVVLWGFLLYAIGALICYFAQSLEVLLAARVLQGIGASAPRTVSLAMVRDLYQGREMARITSLVQMIFTTIPAIAPFMGVGIIWLAGWQSIFLAFAIFAATCALWFGLRQPETLLPERRRPLSISAMALAIKEMFRVPNTLRSMLVQSLTLGMLFSTLSSIQGIFEQQFDRADSFAFWFAVIAVVSILGSLANSRFVMRLGMRRMLMITYLAQLTSSVVALVLLGSGLLSPGASFVVFVVWAIGLFAMMGTTLGNLFALALSPLGHIAGMVSSVLTCFSTVASVLLAIPVGLMFNGTGLPLISAVCLFAALAALIVRFGLTEAKAH